MAIALVSASKAQAQDYSSTSYSTFTCAFAADVSAGNLLVATVTFGHSSNAMPVVSVADNIPSQNGGAGWTQAGSSQWDTSNCQGVAVFYKYNTAASSGTRTVTATFGTNTGAYVGIQLQEFSGVQASSDPLDQVTGVLAASSTTPVTGSITPTTANQLVFCGVAATSTSPTMSAAGLYTQIQADPNHLFASEYQVQTTATAVTGAINFSVASVSAMVAATFKPAVSDVTAPVITGFTLPGTVDSLSIPIATLTATDDVGVTGWLINQSASTPNLSDGNWTASAPTVVHAPNAGSQTFYAWARDASGNISTSSSQSVTVTVAPFFGNPLYQTTASGRLQGAGSLVDLTLGGVKGQIASALLFGVPSAGTPTGTMVVTEASDTFAASGLVTDFGTMAVTESADTLAGVGTVTDFGTMAVTEASDTFAGVGSVLVTVSGTLSVTEASDTFAGTGLLSVVGTLAATESSDVFSGPGIVKNSGTMAVTEASDTTSASGTVIASTITGIMSVTEGLDTFAGSGPVSNYGLMASVEISDTFSAVGTVTSGIITGTMAVLEAGTINPAIIITIEGMILKLIGTDKYMRVG